METVHLSGSDDVYRASGVMRSAAHDMQRAADSMQSVCEQIQRVMENHQTFMTGWLQDFEKILSEHKP